MRQLEAWESEGGRIERASLDDTPRILIVDNDFHSAHNLEQLLHAAGYKQTCVAYSAQAALVFSTELRPDVAFLDMELLDMDSDYLGQRLRERHQVQQLRLIAMTSSPQHQRRDLSRGGGFERYLLKPIHAADLANLLDAQWRREALPRM